MAREKKKENEALREQFQLVESMLAKNQKELKNQQLLYEEKVKENQKLRRQLPNQPEKLDVTDDETELLKTQFEEANKKLRV